MATRFRRSKSLGKFARVNVNKSSVGISVGPRGARYSVNTSGRRTASAGIPGTGLYAVSQKGSSGSRPSPGDSNGMTEAQLRKLKERYNKKIALASERRNKPFNKLKELYAGGKIDEKKYNELRKRDKEIEIDAVILGRSAFIKLADRYVCGKIDSSEYKRLKYELMPEAENEKQKLLGEFKQHLKRLDEFIQKCKSTNEDKICKFCEKEKKLLRPLMKEDDISLCLKCRKKYKELKKYSGYRGGFYIAESFEIDYRKENNVGMSLVTDKILEYR